MVDRHLEAANRALLRAIEATPPATAIEAKLDDVAATTWYYARETDRRPDPGRLRQLESVLATLSRRAATRKQRRIDRARARLERYATGLDPV